MKRLLNTLYITTPNAYVSKDGSNIVVSVEGQEKFRIPSMNIQAINTFGYQGASPGIMKLCADNGIALSFFTPNGRFIGRLQGPAQGNIILRAKLFDFIKNESAKSRLANLFIFGKLINSRAVLRRFVRDYPNNENVPEIERQCDKIKRLALTVLNSNSLEELRGTEGEGAALYFSVFDHLILHQKQSFRFNGRSRRPPLDRVNCMLSMGYSMLANDCAAALEGVGLDPAAGIMHALRPGRISLALDLMEEMRAYIVDRLVISMINTRQISPTDFKTHTETTSDLNSAVIFSDKGLKTFLAAWQARKKNEFLHPFLNEKIPLGLLPHVQAQLLARYLRGDLDNYPTFIIR